MPRRFRFLVFDWDGTLADSTALISESLRAACRDLGEPVPSEEEARFVIGLGLVDAMRHVAPGLAPSRYGDLALRYRDHYLARDDAIVLFAGIREMLVELEAAGFVLGIATGKSRAGLERALAQQGLAGRFAVTRCADEGMPKPHPQMLLRLMAAVDAHPRETLMIGDTTHDLALARGAGASALAVTYGAHATTGLAELEPLATIDSVAELRAWLAAYA